MTRRRIGYCESSGTLIYLPDGQSSTPTAEDCARLTLKNVAMGRHDDWHNPIAWLDAHGRGCTLRLVGTEPHRPEHIRLGGISWDDEHRIDAVLWLAETLALRSRNRWYAICAYDGFSAECRPTREHPTFDAFRGALPELIIEQQQPAPGPTLGIFPESDDHCVVHKVWGPPWTPSHPTVTEPLDVDREHLRSSDHRADVLASRLVGCFHCTKIYDPTEIEDWTDEDASGLGQTAMCARCGVDAVIPVRDGVDTEFLSRMRRRWFSGG